LKLSIPVKHPVKNYELKYNNRKFIINFKTMKMKVKFMIATLILVAFCFTAGAQKNKMPDSDAPAAKSGKPNIVVIMADDINWSNIHVKYEEN